MSERKNIDKLFQEKFKDYEANPSEGIWANIEAKLDEKKRRRVIPFWWKLSGIAAIFLLGFLISKSIYDDGAAVKNSLVHQNNANTKEKTIIKDVPSKHLQNNIIPAENPVANQGNLRTHQTKNKEVDNKRKSNNNNLNVGSAAVATFYNKIKKNIVSEEKNKIKKIGFSSLPTIAARTKSFHSSVKNKSNYDKYKIQTTQTVFDNAKSSIVDNINKNHNSIVEKNPSNTTQTKQIVETDTSAQKNNTKTQKTIDTKFINLDDLKGNSNPKIATKEINKKINDTLNKNSVANNELEELLNEKESKVTVESKRNRWQLNSNVAPIFLGSTSSGSPIDSTLSKNSKSYNTNVGFGIGVSYAVNKKLSVRTGLNKLNLSYTTNDITFFTGIQSKMLANVTPTASSAMIHLQSATNTVNPTSESGLLPFENSFSPENKGSLNQKIGYLEMPVELTYAILDRKFGLKIIGGFSTLFLQDNRITILSEGRDTLLGEANNLNSIHFSANLGLGVKYSFMKSFEFNIEPTVKYQLNTFSANAGNFKPYLMGIYSGISYRF
ncbi:outer membrane beta-barrel protein [Flavobacterium sp.]|uniref:outer membrane beta-barrel protein n=1 Tax=Flavobacterium sp. TaxID=239 RepID=UPI0025EA927F|nr:outer membrane beta-barrel protein [Flavobacterium sp.]